MSELIRSIRAVHPRLRIGLSYGEPVVVGERQVVPVARSVVLTLGRPGGPFAIGFVWNRPVAVLDTWRGQTRRIPIPDVTRRIMLALAASALLLTLAARHLRRRATSKRRAER